jgi:hypothetical protein
MLKAPIAILTANATVRSLVGLNAAEEKYKVYPVVAAQQESAPYIVCRIVGGSPQGKDCGRLVQLVAVSYATSYDDAAAIDEAVISAFDSFTPGTFEGVAVAYVHPFNLSVDDFHVDHKLYSKASTFTCQLG